MAMQYCLNTSTIRECNLSIEQEIRLAAKAGYKGIELWTAEIDKYLGSGGKLSDIKEMLDENGVIVPNLIAFFQWANPDDDIRKKALDEAVDVMETARALGCRFVAAPPSGITEMVDLPLEKIAQYLADLRNAYKDSGVEPLLEFWGHAKKLGSLREAMTVLEILDDPSAKLLADVFHMAKTPGSFELLRSLDGKRLGLFHMNDYPYADDIKTLTDQQRVYPGDGVAPLREIIATLKAIGFDGMLSLELFNREYQKAGAETVVMTGIAKMKALVETP